MRAGARWGCLGLRAPCLEVSPSAWQAWLLSLQPEAACSRGVFVSWCDSPWSGERPSGQPPLLWFIRLVLNMGGSKEFNFLSFYRFTPVSNHT